MNDSSNQGSSLPSPSSLLSGVTPVTTLGNSTNANYVPASTQAVVSNSMTAQVIAPDAAGTGGPSVAALNQQTRRPPDPQQRGYTAVRVSQEPSPVPYNQQSWSLHAGQPQQLQTVSQSQCSTQIHITQTGAAAVQQGKVQQQLISQPTAEISHQQMHELPANVSVSQLQRSDGCHTRVAIISQAGGTRPLDSQMRPVVSLQHPTSQPQIQQHYPAPTHQGPQRVIPSQNSSFQLHPSVAVRQQALQSAQQAHHIIATTASQQPQHITVRQQIQTAMANSGGQQVVLVQQPQSRATLQSLQGNLVQIQPQQGTSAAHPVVAPLQQQQRNEHVGMHASLNGVPQTTVVVQQTAPQSAHMQRAYVQQPVPAGNIYVGSQRYFSTMLAEKAKDPSGLTPKQEYRELKRKFKYLVYENECYQEELRNLQRKLLKLSRDKNFLLDRLANYENASESSEDSDASTKTIEDKAPKQKKKPAVKPKEPKKKATAASQPLPADGSMQAPRKKAPAKKKATAAASAMPSAPEAGVQPPPSPSSKVARLSPSAINESLTRSGALPMVELNEQKVEPKDEPMDVGESAKNDSEKTEPEESVQGPSETSAPVATT